MNRRQYCLNRGHSGTRNNMDGLRIERVQPSRYEEFVDFIYENFFPYERLAIASGLDKKPNFKARPTYLSWLADGLSLAVVDNTTDRIVAIVLNFILRQSDSSPSQDEEMNDENRDIWLLLDELEKGYDIFQQFNTDRGFELVFLCVHQQYCGRGLAKKLTEETIEIARQAGLTFIKSNPSVKATSHIFESLGFETINEKKLSGFCINQRLCFPHATTDDFVRLSVKKL